MMSDKVINQSKWMIQAFGLMLAVGLSSCSPSGSNGLGRSGSTTSSQFNSANSDQNGDASTQLVDRFLSLIDQMSELRVSLEREKDRRGKLQSELLGLSGGGDCGADTVIESMELIIDGKKLSPLNVSVKYDDVQGLEPFTQETAVNFEFYIGSTSKQTAFENNERETPVFVAGMRRPVPMDDKALTLRDLHFIRIEKAAHYHETAVICESGQAGAEECRRDAGGASKLINEQARYVLSRLRIKVNDQLVYERDGIDFGFMKDYKNSEGVKAKGLAWEDADIKLNETYMTFIQGNQCSP